MKRFAFVAVLFVLGHICAATLGIGLPGRAQAQINSPPPALMGQLSFHLYSVPGVIRSAGLATFFACTNTTSAAIRVGVEVFGPPGGAAANDPSATSLNVAAGGTVLFGSGAAGLSVSSDLATGSISKGSARVLATARSGIICSAFIADIGNAPPTSMASLSVVKQTTQAGD